MSFLNNIFGGKEPMKIEDWKVLDKMEQLDELVKTSFEKPVVIFKHSISCGISAMAKHQLESDWNLTSNEVDFYYLDLITYRAISNKIESQFGVYHQSPQIIVIRNGAAVFNTSHHRINMGTLKNAVQESN